MTSLQTTWLRGALLKAVRDAGAGGLDYEELPIRVAESLGLEYGDYGRNPDDEYGRDDAKGTTVSPRLSRIQRHASRLADYRSQPRAVGALDDRLRAPW